MIRGRGVAVAVDKGKSCQYALKWAIDNLIERDQLVKLVHVKERPNLTRGLGNDSLDQGSDAEIEHMFLSYRCFCRLRQVQCETIILEDTDVANALIDFVDSSFIEYLLLGAPTKNGLSRLFRTSDIPGNVMKSAPGFCNVYVITKGRVSSMKRATRSLQFIPALHQNVNSESAATTEGRDNFDELSIQDPDAQDESDRASIDSNFLSFYENFECGVQERPFSYLEEERVETSWDTIKQNEDDQRPSFCGCSSSVELHFREKINQDQPSCSSATQNMDLQEELIKLKKELKQTIDMYHAACKEAIAAKLQVEEHEHSRKKEEDRLKEYTMREQEAISMAEVERAKCMTSMKEVELTQKLLEMEIRRRVSAEMELHNGAEEKKKLAAALGHSNTNTFTFQTLHHLIIALLLLYIYFSVLI